MAFSSLIVCLARDPGPANAVPRSESIGGADNGEEIGLTEALMPDQDYGSPDKWCRKCWVRQILVEQILAFSAYYSYY